MSNRSDQDKAECLVGIDLVPNGSQRCPAGNKVFSSRQTVNLIDSGTIIGYVITSTAYDSILIL